MDSADTDTGTRTLPAEVWTIGHSTHPIEYFIEELVAYRIEALVDVRRFPASRRHPQFNAGELGPSLAAVGIEYHHLPDLGGRRQARPDSPNTAWRNDSFRGYANYMETDEFSGGMERLLELSRDKRTAIMCAEAVSCICKFNRVAAAGQHITLTVIELHIACIEVGNSNTGRMTIIERSSIDHC